MAKTIEQKYGVFYESQIKFEKKRLINKVFFLLQVIDPQTSAQYGEVDIDKAFDDALFEISGLNEVMLEPKQLATVLALLQEARNKYKDKADFGVIRKLLLDSGNVIKKLEDGGDIDA